MIITVTPAGRIQAIAPDDLTLLNGIGKCRTRRVSHVEPVETESGTQWTADLSPVGGPLLGPYQTRSEALTAERVWLEPKLGKLKLNGD